jgi:circadian clock protein KaiC
VSRRSTRCSAAARKRHDDLVIGQAGTGKSTMASLYATAALKRGESVALFLFEERMETFFRRSEGLGMALRQFTRTAS